jgi:N-acetylneuraminic acid mutarotase
MIGRDDHALCVQKDESFITFGGFVNGSRSNEVCAAKNNGEVTMQDSGNTIPARAGHSAICWSNKLYVFGGTDDDNDKLGDLWCLDMADGSSRQIVAPEGEVCPVPRSGHTAVCEGNKMFVFGGILELTKELNDLSIFDLSTEKWVKAIEDPFAEEKEKQAMKAQEEALIAEQNAKGSPFKRMGTMLRPDMT